MDFVMENGLSDNNKDCVTISDTGSVTIRSLNNSESRSLIESVHLKEAFGRRLYCNGLVPLTPSKNVSAAITETPLENDNPSLDKNQLNSIPSIVTEPSSPPDWKIGTFDWAEASNEVVVRRHSISLLNRTPPKNSLAADILERSLSKSASKQTSAIWNSIKDIKEALSDVDTQCFNTANSTLSISSSEEDGVEGSAKKTKRKRKKKAKNEYSRKDFVKKINNQTSPK